MEEQMVVDEEGGTKDIHEKRCAQTKLRNVTAPSVPRTRLNLHTKV